MEVNQQEFIIIITIVGGINGKSVLDKIYSSEIYTNYLRYNPKWYIYLNQDPLTINDFEKEVKTNLKMTSSDKIANLKKQIDFINGMIKYFNS